MAAAGVLIDKRWLTQSAVREALVVWCLGFGAILVAWLVYRPAAKLVATVGFLYLPVLAMSVRGEDYRDFGLSTRTLGRDVKQFFAVSAVVFPLFIRGFGLPGLWIGIVSVNGLAAVLTFTYGMWYLRRVQRREAAAVSGG